MAVSCFPIGYCCAGLRKQNDDHEMDVELTPLKQENLAEPSPRSEAEASTCPRCLQICLVMCGALLLLLVCSVLALAVYLFGVHGTCAIARGDFNAVASQPFGANGVPIQRTLAFPKVEFLHLDPPPNQVSIRKRKDILRIGAQIPRKTASGEWWRGNELGYLVFNPFFWQERGIDPPSIALGSRPSQHAAVRPFLERLFDASSPSVQREVTALIQRFLEERRGAGSLVVLNDLYVMTYQILSRVVLGLNVSFAEGQEFANVQSDLLMYGMATELLPGSFYPLVGHALGMYTLQSKLNEYARRYGEVLEQRFGPELAREDCSPSHNCTVQLASAVLDAMVAAGGASVPQLIGTGLGVLYSKDASSPVPESAGDFDFSAVMEGKEEQFFWEVLRLYPPVVGVPYWEKLAPCEGGGAEAEGRRRLSNETAVAPANESGGAGGPATAHSGERHRLRPSPPPPAPRPTPGPTPAPGPPANRSAPSEAPVAAPADRPESASNRSAGSSATHEGCLDKVWTDLSRSGQLGQWGSGQRVVMSIPSAQKSKKAWGRDHREFVLRPLDTYKANSVGFAEMLVDNDFEGGRHNRVCPGKELALMIGASFFKLMNRSAWVPDTTDIVLQPCQAKYTVSTFKLHPVVSAR
mmetsp:Transcript_94946/g.292714  ORF Transcript_94946/g.292714 Transcript_94946/m.292714 type:complete len:638 (-) Transcript_94946:67-1980(-)